jgi:predicted AlkP superfamily phosphohydrolase/phosphomutase
MKVMILGLDCVTPQLLFERWRDLLPNLKKLMDGGVYGKLTSSIPAITVPAWMSMMTSKTPGELGFYGFRNRKNYSYDEMFFATAKSVKVDAAWDVMGRFGKKVIVVGVPPSYPPKPVNGSMISCFLTPGIDSNFAYPEELKSEILEKIGEYFFDVSNFRTEDKDELIKNIYQLTNNRFKTFEYLIHNKEWDFAMVVEMGPDRLHHGMWKYMDPQHPKYEAGHKYEHVIRDYYIYLDHKIGHLLDALDEDTAVIVVSDHGAKTMKGGICFNDWLIQEGFLSLKQPADKPTAFKNELIDWGKTQAWGSGGYYGRLFMNVAGREPQGIIPPADYEKVREDLITKIAGITDPEGNVIGCQAFRPEDIYPETTGIAPDLIVYFGDLYWRSLGTIGNETIWSFENDTGPDDANHAQEGIFILNHQNQHHGEYLEGLQLMDVAPTALDLMGLPVPGDMRGKSILKKLH